MIKDDFSVEGFPSGSIWKSYGNPRVKGGKLILETSADYVISVQPITLDEGASIVVVFDSGNGALMFTTYDLATPPDEIEGVPFDAVYLSYTGPTVYYVSNKRTLSSISIYPPVTITIQSSKGRLSVYVEGRDFWGKPYPKTLLVETTNQFWGKDVFIHLVGGTLAVDSINASAGKESLSAQMMILMYSVMALVPILILIPLVKKLRELFKPETAPAV
jgi:hypothetical protein